MAVAAHLLAGLCWYTLMQLKQPALNVYTPQAGHYCVIVGFAATGHA